MSLNHPTDRPSLAPPAVSRYTEHDLATILRDRTWLSPEFESTRESALQDWLSRAAELLGPHATDNGALATLLTPIFVYDAAAILQDPVTQDVLARTGAREVIRELANRVLEAGDIDSDRFKEIIEAMKQTVPYRSRAMFQPIRIALTGRIGEGELDRVILLVDSAAKLNFTVPVKTTHQRMLEFCSSLD
jgi:glutamyl/glutaminyl-tRNA synthetase